MKNRYKILMLLLSSTVLTAQMIQFSSGQAAKASDVNSNFNNLNNRVNTLENGDSSNIHNISAFADIDENIAIDIPHIHTSEGIKYKTFKVDGEVVGYYDNGSLLTKKGYKIGISLNSYESIQNTRDSDLEMGYDVYYSSSSCDIYNDTFYINKKFMNKGEMRKIVNKIYYAPINAEAVNFDNITLYSNNHYNLQCEEASTSSTYYQAILNDESVTGFSDTLKDATFTTGIGTVQ